MWDELHNMNYLDLKMESYQISLYILFQIRPNLTLNSQLKSFTAFVSES